MLGSWVKRKIQRAGVRGAREDLESFVESLHGQSNEELGMVVAIAAILRTELQARGHLPDETQLEMSRLVRRFQAQNRFQEALGAMVWLHTLRSLSAPELGFRAFMLTYSTHVCMGQRWPIRRRGLNSRIFLLGEHLPLDAPYFRGAIRYMS
jgi:hypothetical protein